MLLWVASWLGRAGRKVLVDWRGRLVAIALVGGLILASIGEWAVGGPLLAAGGLLLLATARTAKGRLMVGDFATPLARAEPESEGAPPAGAPQVDLANLLQVELSRLGSLFRVVEDRRAVSSGLGPRRALDATLSVDDLVGTLKEAVSAETKVAVGPISIPVAPLMTLAGRAFRAPRLTGSLHRDGDLLILTAQQQGRRGMSWRVTARAPAPAAASQNGSDPEARATPAGDATLSAMITELALRIFTDFALGREVRWQASQSFVKGLNKFRACLRTPKDRKVNLKDAERLFLDALSEDEDFPLVYYNLGVVYTELHGLAVAAGRRQEAEMYLSAAEVSFGWAIDKDSERWETYQAFAQAQMHYERYSSVIELCGRICKLDPPRNHRARANELRARAYLARAENDGKPGDRRKAIKSARRATRLAVRTLFRARLIRTSDPGEDDDRVPRCEELVGACAHTLGTCYSRQLPLAAELARGNRFRRWRRGGILRRTKALYGFADRYLGSTADLHFEFGQRALNRGLYELAEEELGAAAQSDPTRPTYAASLALARALMWRASGERLSEAQQMEIRSRCERAVRDMAGAFFPLRDSEACELVARVYDQLAENAPESRFYVVAQQLRDVAEAMRNRLSDAVSGASVSAFFLEALQAVKPSWREALSEYGTATRKARALLIKGQDQLPGEVSDGSKDKDKSKRRPPAGASDEGPDRAGALKNLRCALTHAERASALNPLSSLAWETLGDVHAELFDFRNARKAWGYALGRDPDNPELYDKIGSSHWQLAFQGRSGFVSEELEQATGYFDRALQLYGSGSFNEQVRAHYRLTKLYTALRRFPDAQPHLRIVEAVAPKPPLVGWVLLGLAHLQQRTFSEAEDYFERVIEEGDSLAVPRGKLRPEGLVGDRLDEREWPLALIRAWAHLGLAFSYAERDGDLIEARTHVGHARSLAGALPDLKLFPTRIFSSCNDCEGYILFKRGRVRAAIKRIEDAIGGFPFSRSYLNLALAYEQLAREQESACGDHVRTARRFVAHAVSLGPEPKPSEEVQQLLARLDELVAA